MCCHMPIHNCLRCSNTLHLYDMDVGCSLKGSTTSVLEQWDHIHIKIIQDFSKLSQIWGNLCGDNGMSICHMPIHNCFRCLNTLHLYDMDVGCSLKGSTALTIAQWDSFHIHIIYDFSKLPQIWGKLCSGKSMNVLSYAHLQWFQVFKQLTFE